MSLINRKINIFAKPVSSLPDHPSQAGMTAASLKAAFDANANGEIKNSINGIVDDLVSAVDSASGADNIGATALKTGGATTVQGQLEELNANKVSKDGDETIAGIKTFSSAPLIPAPSAEMHPTTKKYVDDRINNVNMGDANKLGGQLPSYYATAEQINDLDAEVANNTNKTAVARKAYITIIDDDCKSEWITNGHAVVLANHPNAKMSLAMNPNLIGTTGYLTWSDIDTYKVNAQYEFVNHGYGHQEPLNRSLETLQANYVLEKQIFESHGLGNYDYYVYPGKTSPPTVPNQVSNAELKNKLKKIYKCCLGNSDSKNSYIPFDTYEVKRASAYAGQETKDYIDFCIANNAWCVIFGHSWMAGQTSAVLDDILTYIDGKVTAGEIEYVTVKEMIDNNQNIVEVGDGVEGAEYFYLNKNGAVDFSIQGISINLLTRKVLDKMPVVKEALFTNKDITDYDKNVITIEPISYSVAVALGLPDGGLVLTVRYYTTVSTITNESTREAYNFQICIPSNSGYIWTRTWQLQKDVWCWFPWNPASIVPTANKPRLSYVGSSVFDTATSKPIWCKTKGCTANKTSWQASTAYAKGDVLINAGFNYLCVQSGVSGSSAPAWSQSASFIDGTVKWVYMYVSAVWVDATGATV